MPNQIDECVTAQDQPDGPSTGSCLVRVLVGGQTPRESANQRIDFSLIGGPLLREEATSQQSRQWAQTPNSWPIAIAHVDVAPLVLLLALDERVDAEALDDDQAQR